MATLYEITGEYLELLDLADTTEDEQLFLDTLESIKGELEVKADNYAAVIAEINGNIKKFDAEIDRLKARRDVMEHNVKRMKEHLLNAMQTMNVPEIKGEHYKLKIQKNGGKQKLTLTGDVPDNYRRVVYETDTDKIRKDLEDGIELPFAHLEERGQHVRIS